MTTALVVYGSERGGTAGLAEMIAAELRKQGWEATTQDAAQPADLSTADVVIIGGALYMSRWHKAARGFVRRHAKALELLPVYLFSSGPLDDSAREGDIAAVPQVKAIARRIDARASMTFGGRLTPDAKGFVARSMAKKYAGDHRDPEQVADWVRHIVRDQSLLRAEHDLPLRAEHDPPAAVPHQRIAAPDEQATGSRAPTTRAPAG